MGWYIHPVGVGKGRNKKIPGGPAGIPVTTKYPTLPLDNRYKYAGAAVAMVYLYTV